MTQPRPCAGRRGPRARGALAGEGSPGHAPHTPRGAELWPPVLCHPGECECDDVSACFSCTTGNALGLPPSCPEKVGLASPRGRRSAGGNLVSGPRRGPALPAASRLLPPPARPLPAVGACGGGRTPAQEPPAAGTDGAKAHSPQLAPGLHGRKRQGGRVIAGLGETTSHGRQSAPGQVGRKPWLPPKLGPQSAE